MPALSTEKTTEMCKLCYREILDNSDLLGLPNKTEGLPNAN